MDTVNSTHTQTTAVLDCFSPEAVTITPPRAVFIEPVISRPVDILEATKFFQCTGDDCGSIGT